MITELEKKEIYNFLIRKFELGEVYPLSRVGNELTISGRGCRKYGFSRMKNLMKELAEFVRVEDYEQDGHSNSNVILHAWKSEQEETKANSHFWAATSAEMAELENEMGTGLIDVSARRLQENRKSDLRSTEYAMKKLSESSPLERPYQKRYTGQARVKILGRPARREKAGTENILGKRDFSELEKEKIYQILCGNFPKGEQVHLAKISKYLMDRGFNAQQYGFERMKDMLQNMERYLQLESVIIRGIPNFLITLYEKPLTESESAVQVAQEEKPAAYEFAGEVQKEEPERQGEFYRLAYLPSKILDYLRRRGVADPEEALAEAYQKSLEEETAQVTKYSITFPLLEIDGDELIAVLKRNERPYGRQWYLSYVGTQRKESEEGEDDHDDDHDHPIPPGRSLEHFADMGFWPDFLKDLAELALPEKWDSHVKRYGRYYILKKYVQYTFYRLLQEDKICISADRQFAAFNTGLVNKHYDDIYACFVPNPQQGAEEWKFEAFAIAGIRGKDGYGKILTSYFSPLPQLPSYVEKSEDLIYDLSKELLPDYEHIIIDNLRRLPIGYLRECCYGDTYALGIINEIEERWRSPEERRDRYASLAQYIDDNDKIFRRLRSRMEDAIEISLKRVRWNYKTAIPCYFPKGNCMSLMLPLCLEDDNYTDAALIVQKNPSGSYQGQTLLRLDQAYLDARLICRPSVDWLQKPDYEQETFRKY